MFWDKLPLPPLSSGERDVWATVCVELTSPLQSAEDPDKPAVGYFRNFGMRLRQEDPKQHLERLIADGHIDWEESELREVEPGKLARDVRKRITGPDSAGIWYQSGKMFYPGENSAG